MWNIKIEAEFTFIAAEKKSIFRWSTAALNSEFTFY